MCCSGNEELKYYVRPIAVDALEYIERGDYADMFPSLSAIISKHLAVNYLNEVDSDGQKWPPRKDNLPHPLLRKTLAMYDASTNHSASSHYFEQVSGEEFYSGVDDSAIFYAKYQNYGTKNKDGTVRIPPREFIFVTDRMADDLQAFAGNHLANMNG